MAAGFANNQGQGARVFHLMMIIPAALLLLLSLISLGTLATTNNNFLEELDDIDPNNDGTCILFAEKDGDRVDYTDGNQCKFGIAGNAILAAIAVILFVVFIVKTVLGVGVLSFFALVELGISAFGAVWAFIVSVVITAGLNNTCKAFADVHDVGDFPCCSYFYGESQTSESRVYFYEGINTSRITAWFAMALLTVLTAVYVCILIAFCCGAKRGSSGGPTSTSKEISKDSQPI